MERIYWAETTACAKALSQSLPCLGWERLEMMMSMWCETRQGDRSLTLRNSDIALKAMESLQRV